MNQKYYEFTELEQQSVLKDYYEGCMSSQSLGMKYETSQYHIQKILAIFARKDPEGIKNLEETRIMKKQRLQAEEASKLPDDTESLKNEMRRLQQELKTAQYRAHAFNTMIDVAEKTLHISIRKRHGTRQQ
jgi:septal ring factor EnvC (AmiA/AmiB activator)